MSDLPDQGSAPPTAIAEAVAAPANDPVALGDRSDTVAPSDPSVLSDDDLFARADDLGSRGAWYQAAAVLSLNARSLESDVHTHFRIAYCFLRARIYDEALAISERIIKTSPHHAGTHAIRAAAILGLRRPATEAREALNRAFNYGPDDALVRAVGARVLCEEGHQDAAAQMMAQCMVIAPKDGYVLETLFLLSKRQPGSVTDLLPRDFASSDAEGWRQIGESLAAEGIADAAAFAFRQALERSPTDERARAAVWSMPDRAAFRPLQWTFGWAGGLALLLGIAALWANSIGTFATVDTLLGVMFVAGLLPISLARRLERKNRTLPDAGRPWMWIRGGALTGTFLTWTAINTGGFNLGLLLFIVALGASGGGGYYYYRWRTNKRFECDAQLLPWRDYLELELTKAQFGNIAPLNFLIDRAFNIEAPDSAMTSSRFPCRCDKYAQLSGPLASKYMRGHLSTLRKHHTGIFIAVCAETKREWLFFEPGLALEGSPASIVRVG